MKRSSRALAAISDPVVLARFWAKVDTSGGPDACWPWLAGGRPYGAFKLRSYVQELAHRVAYAISRGAIPAGLDVCHSCDNPPCCNPGHLSLGTRLVNLTDMMTKGRHYSRTRPESILRGERSGRAKVTEAQVRDIRCRWAAGGVTFNALAAEYGISNVAARKIVRRETWREVA